MASKRPLKSSIYSHIPFIKSSTKISWANSQKSSSETFHKRENYKTDKKTIIGMSLITFEILLVIIINNLYRKFYKKLTSGNLKKKSL